MKFEPSFDILEKMTGEFDIVYKATSYPWKAELTSQSYDTLKNRPHANWDKSPQVLIYEKDGHEYLICRDNHVIPFIIHARIANKNAKTDQVILDDLDRPNIEQEYKADYESYEGLE